MAKCSTQDCIDLHNLIFRFVRVQRFVGRKYGISANHITSGLGHTDHSVLFIVNAKNELNIKELAELIQLERSWMSRVVASLLQRGLLVSYVPDVDRRSKVVRLTKQGKEQLKKTEVQVAEMMEECLVQLSVQERKQFGKLLEKFADGLKAPRYASQPDAHPIAYQLGRISAGLGMYADRMLGTEISVAQLHTLLILQDHINCDTQVRDIERFLPFDISTVSRIIEGFSSKGWVTKVQSSQDRRSLLVTLSDQGRASIAGYNKKMVAAFQPALSDFTAEQFKLFKLLYDKVSARHPVYSNAVISGGLRIRPIAEKQAVQALSALRRPVKSAKKTNCAEIKFVAYQDDDLQALLSLGYEVKSRSITSLNVLSQPLANEQVVYLIKSALELASRD